MRIHGTLIADSFHKSSGSEVGTLDVTDNTHSFTDAPLLTFNSNDFYLTNTSAGQPQVNFNPAFSGARLRPSVDLTLVDADPVVALTFADGPKFGHTTWWSVGSPTQIVVPAGVFFVRILGTVGYVATGTPAAGSHCYTVVQVNGVSVSIQYNRFVAVSGGAATTAITVGVLAVQPGDIITVLAGANWVTATGMVVESDRTIVCVEAVPL